MTISLSFQFLFPFFKEDIGAVCFYSFATEKELILSESPQMGSV